MGIRLNTEYAISSRELVSFRNMINCIANRIRSFNTSEGEKGLRLKKISYIKGKGGEIQLNKKVP